MDDAANLATSARAIPAKMLPVPSTASPELQRSIATLTAAPGLALDSMPGSPEEWRAIVAGSDQTALALVPVLAAKFPHQQTISQIAGVTVREIVPASFDPARAETLLIQLHGGGYVLNGGEASTGEAVLAAHYSGLKVIAVDYRMPPDHPFPAAVDDAVAVWKAVTRDRRPASVGVLGTSAGGGLTLAMALKLKALGLPLPGALAPSTPWTDLTGASDSYRVNEDVDAIFSRFDGFASAMARLYAGGVDLDDPLISPVNGDFSGFPPTILTTGTRDILLSDTVRAYRAMRAAGVEARLEVYEALSHAEYIYAFDSPESASAFTDIADFFHKHLAA